MELLFVFRVSANRTFQASPHMFAGTVYGASRRVRPAEARRYLFEWIRMAHRHDADCVSEAQ